MYFSDDGSWRHRSSAQTSRSVIPTSSVVWLVHRPTGVKVKATVPPGHYSRAELIRARSRLERPLWDELERKVAAHLRVPGQ